MDREDQFNEFIDELDEVSFSATQATDQLIDQHMKRWFVVLEDGPRFVSQFIRELERRLNWDTLEETVFIENSGMGPDTLNFPDDQLDRLAVQLMIFRKFSTGEIESWRFADQFVYVRDGNINDTLQEFMYQVFDPFLTELKRALKKQFFNNNTLEQVAIPASDRIVSLDHNSKHYGDAIEAINITAQEVTKSNSMDAETKERIRAELKAGTELLAPKTVKVPNLKVVLLVPLLWLVDEFAGTAIGPIAQRAIDAIITLIPSLT